LDLNLPLSIMALVAWTLHTLVTPRPRPCFLRFVVLVLVLAALIRALVFPPDLETARAIANFERFFLIAAPLLDLVRRKF